MIISNGKLIVTNSGGWGVDSSITFIDLATFTIDTTLNIGYHPNDLVEDVNGNIWVSCQGLGNWDPNGPSAPMLYEINPITKEILNSYTVGTSAQTVKRLAINTAMDVIYYYHENGDAFAFNIDGSTLNDQAFIEGSFYGIALDPATDNVITFDAKGFTASSEMSVYSSTGDSLATYSVGIGANGAFVK